METSEEGEEVEDTTTTETPLWVRVLAAFGVQRERKRLGRVKECARVECGTMLFNASEEDDTIFNEQERSARGFVVVWVEKKRGRKEQEGVKTDF